MAICSLTIYKEMLIKNEREGERGALHSPSLRQVAMAAGFLAVENMRVRHSRSTEEKVNEEDGSCC